MTYSCEHCPRTFGTPFELKRHISEKHQYTNINEDETSKSSKVPSEEPGLWDDEDFTMNDEPGLWDEDFIMNEVVIMHRHEKLI